MNAKKIAGDKAADYVKDGMTIGLGTGSTAYWAIESIGQRVQQGLHVKAVPTSLATEKLAREFNIPIAAADITEINLTIDGADEIDKEKNLIKGGGGALLREKIVAYNSNEFIIVADESKLVAMLGKFPLPIEVVPFGVSFALSQIRALCGKADIRKDSGHNFLTDNGNCIIDGHFKSINNPHELDLRLKSIVGVVETGIFSNTKVTRIIVGYNNGTVEVMA